MDPNQTSSRYQQSQVLSAGREQLLLLAYEGILRFLGRAHRGIQQGDYREKHIGISRAQTLILELRRTLDFSASPELAHNLSRIYTYLLEELTHADGEDDDSRIQHIIHLVSELREAWLDVSQQPGGARVAPAPPYTPSDQQQ